METYENINSMLGKLTVGQQSNNPNSKPVDNINNNSGNTMNNNFNNNYNNNSGNSIKQKAYTNPHQNQVQYTQPVVKIKPEQTYTGFSRDMQLFSENSSQNNMNGYINNNNEQNIKEYKCNKDIANERLQNFQPIPNTSSYLTKQKAADPNALNFQLDSFKKSLNEPDINDRLNQRDMIPRTKQFSLNQKNELPVFESYPVDTNETFIYNNKK